MIDASHAFGGTESFFIALRNIRYGFLIIAFGALSDIVHHVNESAIIDSANEVAFCVLKAGHVVFWQVDADSIIEVFSYIAEYVGELKCVA